MQSAVLEAPSTDANPPGTPTENALQAAHEAAGVRAVESAAALLDVASDRVEALQTAPGDIDRLWVGQMRAALGNRDQAIARLHYLTALAEDQPTEPIPAPGDVDAELVRRTILARGPAAFERLLSQAMTAASSEADKARSIGSRLDAIRGEYERGGLTLLEFVESFGREYQDQARHQARASELRQAIITTRIALERDIGAALGSLSSLRLGVREARQLAQRSDAELGVLVAELARVDADLVALALDQAGTEPGKIGTELAARKIDLVDQIKARKRIAFGVINEHGADLTDRAQGGDAGALAELYAVIVSRPLAFDPGLGDRMIDVMAASLAECGSTFAELL